MKHIGLVHMIVVKLVEVDQVVNAVYRHPQIVKLRGPRHFQTDLKIDYLMDSMDTAHFLYTTVDL